MTISILLEQMRSYRSLIKYGCTSEEMSKETKWLIGSPTGP